MKVPTRTQVNVFLLALAVSTITLSLFFEASKWFDYTLRCVAIMVLIIILFVNYIWNILYYLVQWHKRRPKPSCPYFTAEQCPHGDKRECSYDTSVCHISISKPKNGRAIIMTLLLLLCVIVSVLAELVMQNQGILSVIGQGYDLKTFLKILQPISNSFIAAVVVYFLIDIPGRLREYQDFFVDLLSSDKHLKLMKENQLTKLRKKITWQLHVKDFPNMPRGLIDIDERFCEMLKRPYFKIYSQNTTVSSMENGVLRKRVVVYYTAFNPHDNDKPIKFDIGIANSLRFSNDPTVEEAKTMFKLNSFSISFDDDNREYNILPLIRIGVTKENKDGLLYNGRVVLMPPKNFSNEREPFDKEKIEDGKNKETNTEKYSIIEDSLQAGLFVTFKNKIRVKFEYEVQIPQDDISYTKRLRYPVKYFTLNYSLDESVKNTTVVGQIIGTLIDQPDISAEISSDKKRIILKTQNWLLPKNGAMVVHCNV